MNVPPHTGGKLQTFVVAHLLDVIDVSQISAEYYRLRLV